MSPTSAPSGRLETRLPSNPDTACRRPRWRALAVSTPFRPIAVQFVSHRGEVELSRERSGGRMAGGGHHSRSQPPARTEIIICTGLRTKGGRQVWGDIATAKRPSPDSDFGREGATAYRYPQIGRSKDRERFVCRKSCCRIKTQPCTNRHSTSALRISLYLPHPYPTSHSTSTPDFLKMCLFSTSKNSSRYDYSPQLHALTSPTAHQGRPPPIVITTLCPV